MNIMRRTIGTVAALALLAGATATVMADHHADKDKHAKGHEGHDHAHAKLGDPAPDFTLTDTTGEEHSLKDFEGKIVVLEWINWQCPYVKDVYSSKSIAKAYESVKEIDEDIVWIAIDSSHFASADDNNDWIKEHKIDHPILLDQAGTVGKTYGARTTPHMFVIDAEGVLRYHGAFDNNPMGRAKKQGKEIENYVVNAVKQIKSGETVAPDYVKQWGCSVKYKKKR